LYPWFIFEYHGGSWGLSYKETSLLGAGFCFQITTAAHTLYFPHPAFLMSFGVPKWFHPQYFPQNILPVVGEGLLFNDNMMILYSISSH